MLPHMRIVFEDAHLIALDKPAGMPSASLAEGEQGTAASWLLGHYRELATLPNGPLEAGLVHRLDNDTSGILLAAKTGAAYDALRKQFVDGTATKEYLALVVGAPPASGMADAPIAHHPRKKNRMVVCESPERSAEWKGRPASTAFCVLERFVLMREGVPHPYALLRVNISTGVRHQIRVHLAHLGFPVAGDALYRNTRRRAADALEPTRQCLHALRLSIIHPAFHERQSFEAALPGDMSDLLKRLRRA